MIKTILGFIEILRCTEGSLNKPKNQNNTLSHYILRIIFFIQSFIPPIIIRLFEISYATCIIIKNILKSSLATEKLKPSCTKHDTFIRNNIILSSALEYFEPIFWPLLFKKDYELKQVKIKEIYFEYISYKNVEEYLKKYKGPKNSRYDWNQLRQSIKTYGVVKPINVEKIQDLQIYEDVNMANPGICTEKHKFTFIHQLISEGYTHVVSNGNHRLLVLRDLYGDDAVITVACKNKNAGTMNEVIYRYIETVDER